jgi:hypothetical protein
MAFRSGEAFFSARDIMHMLHMCIAIIMLLRLSKRIRKLLLPCVALIIGLAFPLVNGPSNF